MRKQLGWSFFVFLLASSAAAEIYQWVDDHGRRHYSDRPGLRAEIVEIEPGYALHRVEHVYDGDTILLTNGQKVRLLGINTPEVESRSKMAEPGGDEAKRWLAQQLSNQKVRLETDVEKKDKYGRLLAHVFTENGKHLNLALVKKGLATVNIYPPNLRHTNELLRAQELAEKAGVGLWANPYYASRSFRQLNDRHGWKRVTGRVIQIKPRRKNIYLHFSDNFSIKIARVDQKLFPDITQYRGKRVEVRGWIKKYKDYYTIRARHPGHIKVLEQRR